MSGLIWKALGKGITDSTSVLASMMMKDNADRAAEERTLRAEERADKRLEEREIRAQDRKEADLKRDADIYAKAEAAAPGVGDERRFAKFKADLGESALSEEEQRSVFESQYNQRKVGAFEGADRYLERYSKLKEDVLGEIRKGGGSSGLITQATAEYKSALESEKAADRLAFDERRLEATEARRDREFAALLPIRQQTAQAATTRAERPTGGGSGGVTESNITQAESTLATTRDKVAKQYREPTVQEKYNAAALAKYTEEKNRYVNEHPDVKRQAARLESLYAGQRTGSSPSPAPGNNSNVKPGTRPPLSSFAR